MSLSVLVSCQTAMLEARRAVSASLSAVSEKAWSSSRAGAPVVGGLDLLVHQAVGQVELMTGRQIDVAVLREAGERALAAR